MTKSERGVLPTTCEECEHVRVGKSYGSNDPPHDECRHPSTDHKFVVVVVADEPPPGDCPLRATDTLDALRGRAERAEVERDQALRALEAFASQDHEAYGRERDRALAAARAAEHARDEALAQVGALWERCDLLAYTASRSMKYANGQAALEASIETTRSLLASVAPAVTERDDRIRRVAFAEGRYAGTAEAMAMLGNAADGLLSAVDALRKRGR